MPLAELHHLLENPRDHDARQIDFIADSMQAVGAHRSGVIDETGTILAGNGMAQAAAQAGMREAIVVRVEGDRPVFVERSNLDASQKARVVVDDNRAGERSTWNTANLLHWGNLNPDVRKGWTAPEWSKATGTALKPGRTDPDEVPAERPTAIQRGDLYQLGQHRLLCGDSTSSVDVGALFGDVAPVLMVTDPPYGIEYDPTWRAEAGINRNRKKMGKVTNDGNADWRAAWALFPGPVAYVWHAGLKASIVEASLVATGFELRSQIVWAKDRLALSRGDYHWQHEPCWYAVRKGSPGHRTSDRSQSTLWTIPARDDSGHGHGTQKPVECMARPIRNHDAPTVYDPFVGSGTTIIAAEMLGRACFAIETEPAYCQIAIDRWEAFAGEKAELIGRVGKVSKVEALAHA